MRPSYKDKSYHASIQRHKLHVQQERAARRQQESELAIEIANSHGVPIRQRSSTRSTSSGVPYPRRSLTRSVSRSSTRSREESSRSINLALAQKRQQVADEKADLELRELAVARKRQQAEEYQAKADAIEAKLRRARALKELRDLEKEE